MLEAIPKSSRAIVDCVPSLCRRLLCIEYIDLAEQSLNTLSKLARDQGRKCLEMGGLNACLAFIDFFPIAQQVGACR